MLQYLGKGTWQSLGESGELFWAFWVFWFPTWRRISTACGRRRDVEGDLDPSASFFDPGPGTGKLRAKISTNNLLVFFSSLLKVRSPLARHLPSESQHHFDITASRNPAGKLPISKEVNFLVPISSSCGIVVLARLEEQSFPYPYLRFRFVNPRQCSAGCRGRR